MANPVQELRSLLSRPILQISGVVIEVLQNQTYRVRTMSGSLEAKAVGNVTYPVNSEVLVRNGIIQGRLKNAASIPIYSV